MSSGLKKRMASILACALTLTSFDGSVFVTAAEQVTDESVYEEVIDSEKRPETREGVYEASENAVILDDEEEIVASNTENGLIVESVETYGAQEEIQMKTIDSDNSESVSELEIDKDIKAIVDVLPRKDIFYTYLDQFITDGTVLTVTYSDDTTEILELISNDYITNSHGKQYNIFLKKEGEEERTYSAEETLSEGKYALQLTNSENNHTVISDYVYIVETETTTETEGFLEESVIEDSTENTALEDLVDVYSSSDVVPQGEITELVLGEKYQVNLDEENPDKWFKYIPVQDVTVAFRVDTEDDSCIYLYDAAGSEIAYDENGIVLSAALSAGQSYYFYLKLDTEWSSRGQFQISFTERSQVTDIEIVSCAIQEKYLCNDWNYPRTKVKIHYADGGEGTATLWEQATENYGGSSVNARIVNAATGEIVEDEYYDEAVGTYKYQIVCGNVVKDVAEYCIVTLAEYIQGEAEDLVSGKIYQISLQDYEEEKWFRYTPLKDTRIYFSVTGDETAELTLYDGDGKKLAGDIEENVQMRRILEAGKTYCFKVKLAYADTGNLQVSFLECPQLTSLMVVNHTVKAVYTRLEKIEPDITVKAVYSDGSEEIFSSQEKDKYGNMLESRIVTADTKEAVTGRYDSSKKYLYQFLYKESANYEGIDDDDEEYSVSSADIIADVAEFQVAELADSGYPSIDSEAGMQMINALEKQFMYQFSVKNAGIYMLESSVPFKNSYVYDLEENEMPSRARWRPNDWAYETYAVLEPGTYYMVAEVKSYVTSMRVAVEEVVLPSRISIQTEQQTLIAGLDKVEEDEFVIKVDYSNGESAVYKNKSTGVMDAYGTYYHINIKDDSGDYLGAESTVSVGTYTTELSMRRTTAFDDAEEEGQYFSGKMKNMEIQETTIQAVIPDLENLEKLSEDTWTKIDGRNIRELYAFTAAEKGTYCLNLEKNSSVQYSFYYVKKNQLKKIGGQITLEKGDTCIVIVSTDSDAKIRIAKMENSDTKTNVQSIKIVANKDYIFENEYWENDMELVITYIDQSEARYPLDITIYDEYENHFECPCWKEKKEDGSGYVYRMTAYLEDVEGVNLKTELKIPLKTLSEEVVSLTENVTVSGSLKETKTVHYMFTAEEDGNYTFCVEAPENKISVGVYYKDKYDTHWEEAGFYKCVAEKGYAEQNIVYLKKGESYYFRIRKDNIEEAVPYRVSVFGEKGIEDIEIASIPTDKIYAGLSAEDRLDGLQLKVTYKDGTEETVNYKKPSKSGSYICVYSEWITTKTCRVYVQYNNYKIYTDLKAKSWDTVTTVKQGQTTELQKTDGAFYFKFIPEQSGIYNFELQGEKDTLFFDGTVRENNTNREVQRQNGGYYLNKDVQYHVDLTLEADVVKVTPIAGPQKHTHMYEEIYKNATCTEKGYVGRKCKTCGQLDGYMEIPAVGHSMTATAAKAATCTAEGTKAYWTCGTCHKVYADVAGTQETTVAAQKISATGHKLTATAAKAATCTAEGTKAYWICGTCHKVYANAAGTQETTVGALKLPKTGHSFGDYKVTKQPTVLSAGTKTRTCANCNEQESKSIAKLNGTIKLTTNKLPLQVKKSVELSKIVTGLSAGDSIVSCTSNAVKIATVNNKGKVTGKKAGTAKITIKLASGASAVVTVTVQKKAVATSSIKNVAKKLKLQIGEKYTLKPVISPITTTDKLSYSTSNKKIVTVNKKGVIEAKKSGTAKITVQSGKKKFTVTVTVEKKAPTGMTGVPESKALKKGKSFTLKPKLTPSGAEAKISYKSSNKKIVTVTSKGKVTAKGKGTATITVTAGKVTRKCKITVR